MSIGAGRKADYRRLLITTAVTACSTGALQGMATAQEQEAYTGTTALPAITVTGQKMDRSLQDTAVSVSVVTADDIEQKPDADTIADMLQGIPNVLFTNNVDAPIIRGIDTKGPIVKGNAYLAKPIPRATISVDGRYLNPSELDYGAASMWDVDSIEVFRGPQTTTQGAHSMAGAVVINTKDPTFTQELAGQVLYGSYEKKRVSFMANGPIMQDLAARFAFDYSGRDTFIDYTNPAFTARAMDQDFEDINARMKLRWEPSAIPGLEAKLTYSHTRIKRPSDELATYPYDNLESEAIYVDSAKTKTDTGIFDLKYDFGNDVVLRNQLQYSDGVYDFVFAEPFSGLASRDYQNLSNEFRVNFGNEDAVWSGVAGIYYSNDKARNRFSNVLGSADADLMHRSVGIFSEVNWRFSERWALTGGLRYQNDRIGHDGVSSYVPGVRHDYEKTFDAILPSISLAYDVTDDVTVGGLISRGYLPGGTGVNFRGGEYYTFDEETAWNYELFARANLLEDRLSITGNLFYTRYEGSQRSVTDYLPDGRPFGSIIINADRADAYGLELSADYQVLDNLRLRGGLGLLHTDITRFADYRGNEFEGKEFAKAPGYMFNVGADWDVTDTFRVSGDLRFTDGYFSNDINEVDYRVGSYYIANVRMSYKPTENYEIFAFANNIFDNRAPIQKSFDRMANKPSASMIAPREIGIGMKVSF